MPHRTLVKLLLTAAALGFSAARAGADDYGVARSGHSIKRMTTQGADDYGVAGAPGPVRPQGADDQGTT